MEQPNNFDKENAVENDIKLDMHAPHSDKEMLIHVALKFLLVFIIILSFDFLIDLTLMALELIFEVIHLLIEFIEEILESVIAETFSTAKHHNEVIIVNVALIIVLFGLYKLFHGVRFVYRLKRHLTVDWLNYKKRKSSHWQSLSLASKIKLVCAYCLGFTLIFLFAF
ncbi:hypothetical protein AU255_09270 [Methyloprofundus sedimenti]|uniref:Uncharacterized protein n=1 Tax=Methyloprofundus sedimenti TaxID=1420851 RepID=A0A1V8M8Y9_9GAMM|nr:hypothetical protein [Methyloprofundus sedimenti]OQK18025.1 hypothetical protein AU255_09270 [Methyloprofundus sedimenti]